MNFKYCQYVYQPAIQQVRHNKGGWDFHIKRYNQINFALKYKLELDIHNLKQQPEQSMTDFHSQMSLIWDQFVLMAPNWTHDANLYYQLPLFIIFIIMIQRHLGNRKGEVSKSVMKWKSWWN